VGWENPAVAKILVVEDDAIFRQTLESVLTPYQHQVSSAQSSQEALALARTQNFELVICDVRIAGEVDGVEALSQIRKLQPQIRSIVMTGYSDVEVPLRAAHLQADDYLLKPFKMQALLKSLSYALEHEPAPANFLSRVAAVPGQAASRALRWFFDSHLQQLEEQRQKCMTQFYLLVRSKRITQDEAMAYFGRWEEIELQYYRQANPQRRALLLGEYQAWARQLLQLDVPPMGGSFTAQAFSLVYSRIQSGMLDSSHLLKAVPLLHLPEARRQSLENFCIYQWLWGNPSDQGDPLLGLTIKGYRLVRLQSGSDSLARLYEAEAEVLPQQGDRILTLPATPEWTPLMAQELEAERASLLDTQHGHHFLFYSSYATSLWAKLPREGLEPVQAWKLLRPVFHQVAGYHAQGQASGSFSLRDIDWPPDQECRLSHFSSAAYRDAYQQFQKGGAMMKEFYAAPEVIYLPEPTPASDLAVLGRLLFEVVFGGRYPDASLRWHLRVLGSPESNQAFAPYMARLGPLSPAFYRLAHSQPQQRFPELSQAIQTLDAAL